MKYLIDTDTCIYIMNKRPAEVIKKFKQFDLGEIGISIITVSELQFGVSKSKSNYREKNQNRLEKFLAPFEILTYDEKAAKTYGDIRFQLETSGQSIRPLDLLIAAHALSNDLTLITNNEKEFKRINKLKVENWTR